MHACRSSHLHTQTGDETLTLNSEVKLFTANLCTAHCSRTETDHVSPRVENQPGAMNQKLNNSRSLHALGYTLAVSESRVGGQIQDTGYRSSGQPPETGSKMKRAVKVNKIQTHCF